MDEIQNKLDKLLEKTEYIVEVISDFNKFKKNEWLDSADMKMILKISDRTLYRLRKKHCMLCKQIGGKWYFSNEIIKLNK